MEVGAKYTGKIRFDRAGCSLRISRRGVFITRLRSRIINYARIYQRAADSTVVENFVRSPCYDRSEVGPSDRIIRCRPAGSLIPRWATVSSRSEIRGVRTGRIYRCKLLDVSISMKEQDHC